MEAARLIDRLEAFGGALPRLVAGVTVDEARWKPPSGAWSILEIVCHLVDEESLDFRRRLELTLRDPGLEWPPNDPEAWAREGKYNERELGAQVARFVSLRAESVAWLRSLRDPDWTRAHVHPRAPGPLSAGMLLGSWAAHDALHIRQIAKRMYEIAERDCGESVRYAGEWGA